MATPRQLERANELATPSRAERAIGVATPSPTERAKADATPRAPERAKRDANPIMIERARDAVTPNELKRAMQPATPTISERGVYPGDSDGKTCNRYAAAKAVVASGWRPIGNGITLCGHEASDWPVMVFVLGFEPTSVRLVDYDLRAAEAARAKRPYARILTGDVLDLDMSDTSYLNLDFCNGLKANKHTIAQSMHRLRGDAVMSLTWCRRNGTSVKGRLDDDRRNAANRTAEMLKDIKDFTYDWHRLYWGWYFGTNGAAMSTVVYRRGGIQSAATETGDFGPWNKRLAVRAKTIRNLLHPQGDM